MQKMLTVRTLLRACLHCRNVSRHKATTGRGLALAQLCQSQAVRVVDGISNNRSLVNISNFCTNNSENLKLVNEKETIMSSINKKPFRRLPTDVVPYHYDISLTPDLDNFSFTGSEDIFIEVKTSTDTVVLNCLDIDVKSIVFENSEDGKQLPANKIDYSSDEETVVATFPEKLALGKNGRLILNFVGKINERMVGFYRSKYTGTDGKVKYAAVTQFESTDARRCFPCWDEPAHKATFAITLKVAPDLTALSNTPIKDRVLRDGLEILQFERTPIMSTYLVAIVVGEFDYVEDKTSDGVLVRVYTPKSKQEQGRFALEVATKVLPYYTKYFYIEYPLPKMDLIAIADFSAGAMENWGLVTYRETCLLVDPENTSAVQKQWIALVVAHELAHQWFGNLVTMEWWTHLWLNEGYASFTEFLCVDHLFPEYDIWTQFVTDTFIRALELDGLKNSHPIEVPVGHPSEIDEIFDDISYNKGACIIRMLHAWLGDDVFRKGMNLYLERHRYANAETEDLWDALEAASEQPVRAVMTTWTKQQGFPILTVNLEQKDADRVVTITQNRFLSDGSPDTTDSLWMIPVSMSSTKDPKKIIERTVMKEKEMTVVLKDEPEGTWINVNPGTIGFYRTRYSPEALELIVPAIRDRTIDPLDRLRLLDDLSAMVQANLASTDQVLNFVEAFQQEDNYTVWASIANSLSKIGVLVGNLDIEDTFKAFGRSLFKDVASRVGWDPKPNESHLDTLLRSLVLGRMTGYRDEETIREAHRRFELHLKGEPLPADLRSPVYRAVLSSSDPKIYEAMLDLYRKADLHEEKDRILRSLGAIRDEALLSKALDFAMTDEVRAQDTVFAIMSVAMSYKGRHLAWDFVKKNWQTFRTRYDSGVLIARLVKYTTENFVTLEKAKDIEEFFQKNPAPGTERTVQQCIETIKLNAAWLNRDRELIEKYLLAWQANSEEAAASCKRG